MDPWDQLRSPISTGSNELGGGGNYNVSLPDPAEAGDWLAIVTQNVDNPPTGWALLAGLAGSSSTLRVYYRVATGGEQTVTLNSVSNWSESVILNFHEAQSGYPSGGGYVDDLTSGVGATTPQLDATTGSPNVRVTVLNNQRDGAAVSTDADDELIAALARGSFHDGTDIIGRPVVGASAPGATYTPPGVIRSLSWLMELRGDVPWLVGSVGFG